MSITSEQLDEIGNLAEEATPDPWCVAIRGSEVTIEATGVECFVVAEMPRFGATDVQDATFIRAMREYALPLVKALREARALLAAIKEEHRPADEIRSQLLTEIEAHAETKVEVEQLRSVLRQVHALAENGKEFNASEAIRGIHKITKGMVE